MPHNFTKTICENSFRLRYRDNLLCFVNRPYLDKFKNLSELLSELYGIPFVLEGFVEDNSPYSCLGLTFRNCPNSFIEITVQSVPIGKKRLRPCLGEEHTAITRGGIFGFCLRAVRFSNSLRCTVDRLREL